MIWPPKKFIQKVELHLFAFNFKKFPYMYLPVSFAKFLRTPFFIEHLSCLLLEMISSRQYISKISLFSKFLWIRTFWKFLGFIEHKMSLLGILSVSYFSIFGLNKETYRVNLRIHFECGKIRTWKLPNMDTFYAVFCFDTLPLSWFIKIWRVWKLQQRTNANSLNH